MIAHLRQRIERFWRTLFYGVPVGNVVLRGNREDIVSRMGLMTVSGINLRVRGNRFLLRPGFWNLSIHPIAIEGSITSRGDEPTIGIRAILTPGARVLQIVFGLMLALISAAIPCLGIVLLMMRRAPLLSGLAELLG